MKIGVVGMYHETNTFAPGRTELSDFSHEWVHGTEAFFDRYANTKTSMGGVIDAVNQQAVECIAGLYTGAIPSGMISAKAADALLSELISSIPSPIDGLLIILHGAMVSEQYMDMEGELLKSVRHFLGKHIPIAITLDLHANISEAMVEHCDIVVGYRTYPHVDTYERAVEAMVLLCQTVKKEIEPRSVLMSGHMLIPPQAMLTTKGRMKELMDLADVIRKQPGILNVTVAGGFPYSDVPDAGFSVVVTADNDEQKAYQAAAELVVLAQKDKNAWIVKGISPQEAVKQADLMEEGPIILVEGSDNVGGGAPGDATHVLHRLKDSHKTSLIVIRDQEAVHQAFQLGKDGIFNGTIGGKSDRLHGEPVRLKGVVQLVSNGKYRHVGEYMTGQWADMGHTAVVVSGPLTVILTENRVPPWDPGHILSLGLKPQDYHMIAVKSAVAWKTAFGGVAREAFEIDSPGCCGFNLKHFNYNEVNRPIFPLDSSIMDQEGK